MAENLRVTHYRNGEAIPNVIDNNAWTALSTGAYCWYDNDQPTNAKYGALYNWFTGIDSRGLCPQGWHVPTHTEWTALTTYLGGTSVAAGKMKSASALWESPNINATNNSGFSGLPGGFRFDSGICDGIGLYGFWWSSSGYTSYYAWTRELHYDDGTVFVEVSDKRSGYSVRCLRD